LRRDKRPTPKEGMMDELLSELLERIFPMALLDDLLRTNKEDKQQRDSEVVLRALQCTLIVLSAPDEIRDDKSIAMLREVLNYIVEPLHKAPQEAPDHD